MAKVHHIFIIYDVLTNNFHTHQLFTSSSPCFLPIVFPILPPPFLPSHPRFLAVSPSLSCCLLRPVLQSSSVFPVSCSALSCYLHHAVLPAVPSLSYSMRHTVLVSHTPRTCKLFSLLSYPVHAFLHSRTCPSTSENMPFLMLERALLDARKAFSTFAFITIWNSVGYVLPSCQYLYRKERTIS